MKTNYFASNLRTIRKLHKMTQLDLANVLNISRATISAWEKETRNPIVADVVSVCEYFNIPIQEMLGADLSQNYDIQTAFDNQRELLSLFSRLTHEQQTDVLSSIKGMLQQ